MKILALSGRKQSGKSLAGNFIIASLLSKLLISKQTFMDNNGNIVVTDFLGNQSYSGIFSYNPLNTSNDDIINAVYKKLKSHVAIYNFADALKTDICINILGMPYRNCYGTDQNKNELVNCFWPDTNKQMTAREVMQYVGTDIFRKMQNNVWADSALLKIKKNKTCNLAIITDCRFPNEVEAVKKSGGQIVRLCRNQHGSVHSSESALDKDNYDWSNFDHIVDNSETSINEYLSLLLPIVEKYI
tara:strand:- start:30832 stop:31563 length:732 start_codon:yes stop_codon:yes gene_type:complete